MKKTAIILLMLISVSAFGQKENKQPQKEFTDSTVAFSIKDIRESFFRALGDRIQTQDGQTIVIPVNEYQVLYALFIQTLQPYINRWKQNQIK